jgi:hypothetical protein
MKLRPNGNEHTTLLRQIDGLRVAVSIWPQSVRSVQTRQADSIGIRANYYCGVGAISGKALGRWPYGMPSAPDDKPQGPRAYHATQEKIREFLHERALALRRITGKVG